MLSTSKPSKDNCLLICYFYPPIKSIAVLRAYYISQFIAPYFDDIHVITTSNRNHLTSDSLPEIESVKIYEAFTFDYRTLSTLHQRSSVAFEEKNKSSAFVKFLIKLNKSFPTTLLWGEGGLFYIIHAFFIAVKLIKKHKIKTVYSSFSPYSDHFVAYLLKFFFPKLYWIADFRDLHIEPHYDIVCFKSFQHWCNQKILKKANLVTTISDGLAKHLKIYNNNVYVFKNGIPPINISEKEESLKPTKQIKFSVSYTGSMYGNERNPTLLLQVIKDLYEKNLVTKDNFQIIYAGKDTFHWLKWIEQFAINPLFESKGMLSLLESKKVQSESHINLLLTSATPEWTGVMTGKFYEYLAAKNPIIVLIDGSQDLEFESMMNDLNAGCVVYNNQSFNELKSFILEKFNEWQRTGDVKPTVDLEKLKELSWENQVEKFVEHINL